MNRFVKLSDTGYFDEKSENFSLIYNFIKDRTPIRWEIGSIKFDVIVKLNEVPIKILNSHDSIVVTFYEDDYEPTYSDYSP